MSKLLEKIFSMRAILSIIFFFLLSGYANGQGPEEEITHATIMTLLSSVLTGLAFGFVVQHGRYCMNTGFQYMIL
jgi:hypothetical protein